MRLVAWLPPLPVKIPGAPNTAIDSPIFCATDLIIAGIILIHLESKTFKFW